MCSSLGNILDAQKVQGFFVSRKNDNYKSCSCITVLSNSKALLAIMAKYRFPIRAWALLYPALLSCL